MTALFPPAGVAVYSVGELTRAIKELLEDAHPSVWVQGEVSNLARPASGHLYLTLKDETAPLKTVIYRSPSCGSPASSRQRRRPSSPLGWATRSSR